MRLVRVLWPALPLPATISVEYNFKRRHCGIERDVGRGSLAVALIQRHGDFWRLRTYRTEQILPGGFLIMAVRSAYGREIDALRGRILQKVEMAGRTPAAGR